MLNQNESLNKKDLNQVAGGGPSRGKLLKDNPLYKNPEFIRSFQQFNAKLHEQGKPLISIKDFAKNHYQKT